MEYFGKRLQAMEGAYEIVRQKVHIMDGFVSFVVMFPRRKAWVLNSTEHAGRVLGSVRQFYEAKNRRTHGKGMGDEYGHIIEKVVRGLRKNISFSQITKNSGTGGTSQEDKNEDGLNGARRRHVMGFMVVSVARGNERERHIETKNGS